MNEGIKKLIEWIAKIWQCNDMQCDQFKKLIAMYNFVFDSETKFNHIFNVQDNKAVAKLFENNKIGANEIALITKAPNCSGYFYFDVDGSIKILPDDGLVRMLQTKAGDLMKHAVKYRHCGEVVGTFYDEFVIPFLTE